MGTNNLTTRSDGEAIPASDHNEILQALREDLVPRNNSNAPEDIIGQLGTSTLRWLRAYVKEYRIGDAANNLIISEPVPSVIRIEKPDGDYIEIAAGEIRCFMNGVEKFKVTDSGISWATQADKSIPTEKVADKVSVESSIATMDGSERTVNIDMIAGKLYIINFNFAGATNFNGQGLLTVSITIDNVLKRTLTGATASGEYLTGSGSSEDFFGATPSSVVYLYRATATKTTPVKIGTGGTYFSTQIQVMEV